MKKIRQMLHPSAYFLRRLGRARLLANDDRKMNIVVVRPAVKRRPGTLAMDRPACFVPIHAGQGPALVSEKVGAVEAEDVDMSMWS